MITTLPNAMMKLVHDRMPAVLTEEQIPPYLAGDLQEFGPSATALTYTQAENFLKRKNLEQGELFELPVSGEHVGTSKGHDQSSFSSWIVAEGACFTLQTSAALGNWKSWASTTSGVRQ